MGLGVYRLYRRYSIYRRLAATLVADLNVIIAEITVMSSTSHPSFILFPVCLGSKHTYTSNRRRAIYKKLLMIKVPSWHSEKLFVIIIVIIIIRRASV